MDYPNFTFYKIHGEKYYVVRVGRMDNVLYL